MSTLNDTYLGSVNITGTGNSDPIAWKGGWGTLIVSGDFDGATLAVEADFGDGVWVPQRDFNNDAVSLDAAAALPFLLCRARFRAVVSGGAGNPDLRFWVRDMAVDTVQRY